MKTKVVSIRLPEGLQEIISMYSAASRLDNATAMRQWLYKAAEIYALELVEQGRISATRAAELLDVSVWDVFDLAERHGVQLGPTAEQVETAHQHMERFLETHTIAAARAGN